MQRIYASGLAPQNERSAAGEIKEYLPYSYPITWSDMILRRLQNGL